MTRRFWIGAALAVPVVILEMGAHVPGLNLHHFVAPQLSIWVQFLLATPVVLWAGWPFFVRGWASVRNRSLNMFSLIALGIGTAYLYSLAATFAPSLFPENLRQDGVIPVYYEAAAVITVLVLLGQILELRAREQTGGAIRALLNLAPKTARRIRADGGDEDMPLEAGAATFGRSLARAPGRQRAGRRHGHRGSQRDRRIHGDRRIDASRESTGRQSDRRHHQRHRKPHHARRENRRRIRCWRVSSKWSRKRSAAARRFNGSPISSSAWFVPAVIIVAVASFIAWMMFGPPPAFAYALVAAVSVVIIACPCALGLATPMSIMVGVGKGASAGVLIKNAEALERFEKIDTLVVDKTGTLTEGKPRVVAVIPAKDFDEDHDLIARCKPRASERTSACCCNRRCRNSARHKDRRRERIPLGNRQGRHRKNRSAPSCGRQCRTFEGSRSP